MKKTIVSIFCALMISSILFTGCGNNSTSTAETAVEATDTEEAGEATDTEVKEEVSDEITDANEAEAEKVTEEEVKEDDASSELTDGAAVLEDGVYTAEFNTDSGMFHANEACDGKGTLTVENGIMTFHVSLVSKKIKNLYVGLADDAQKDGAVLLEPTVDEVTYFDGTTEEVFGFDIPLENVNTEFDLALIGEKGKWYDHKVSIDNPEKQ